MLFARRLTSILIFYLDVALKYFFPFAHQFDDVINLAVTQVENTVCSPVPFFFFSLRKIELNKCVFCASGSSSAQCSNPFYIFTLAIVLIQNIKCDGVTSYTNRAGFYCYYLEMLYNGYRGSIVLHCDRFG